MTPAAEPRTGSANSLKQARDPLVLALDIGSSASRARVYDAAGAPLRGTRHRIPHAIQTAPDGTAILDADALVTDVYALLATALAERKLAGRIAGVAMDTFASSLIGVDAAGAAVTPCYTYADARPAAQVRALRAELDEAAVQQRTGCRLHTGYLPARLRWLRETEPELFARAVRWVSLGEYIQARLTGEYAVSYSVAAWTGLLDRHALAWDAPLLAACGVRADQFSPLHDTTEPLPPAETALRRLPLPEEALAALSRAVWFPPVADGYPSNVGSGATDESTMALAAGTSGALRVLVEGSPAAVPAGLWCYRVDRRHSLLGGALNDVGRLVAWLRARLILPDDAALSAALLAPPGERTPAVLPFLTGERSPGWAAEASATFAGITDATSAVDLFRGALEGVALRYALVEQELRGVAPAAGRVIASGGVTESLPGWLQITADALGRPVTRLDQKQATMRGTALIALAVLAPEVPRGPATTAETYLPDPERAAYYLAATERQQGLYRALRDGPTGQTTPPTPAPSLQGEGSLKV